MHYIGLAAGLVAGFFLLVKCADMFVDGSSNLAKSLGVPSLIVGLTIVAFGTSAPEAAVSVSAAIGGYNEITVGNVVGSNICNLLLVLGLSAMFAPLKAKREVIVKDYIVSLVAVVIAFIITADSFIGGKDYSWITRSEGFILLAFICVYIYSLFLGLTADNQDKVKEEREKFSMKSLFNIVIGIGGVLLGGNVVVNCSVSLANLFGVSQHVIALTIVAIGTSLPELVTSVVAARKGETDIALGNVIGSNIFNIFFILGLSAAINPIKIDLISFTDIIILGVVSLIVYIFALKNRRIGNKKGPIMLAMYAVYMAYVLIR